MAKRKKIKRTVSDAPVSMSGGSERLSTDISEAENGYIVNVSGETGGKKPSYFSKRFISPTREGALSIVSSQLSGSHGKGSKKKGTRKKIALKKG